VAFTVQEREKQMQQAEELLFSGPQRLGFAKALYFGHFNAPAVFPYPQMPEEQRRRADAIVTEVSDYLAKHVDPTKIDREADLRLSELTTSVTFNRHSAVVNRH